MGSFEIKSSSAYIVFPARTIFVSERYSAYLLVHCNYTFGNWFQGNDISQFFVWRFIGVAVMDTDFERIDFNPCDAGDGNPGPSYLAGTHRCKKHSGVGLYKGCRKNPPHHPNVIASLWKDNIFLVNV